MWMMVDQTAETKQPSETPVVPCCGRSVDACCVALDWEAIGKLVRERTASVVALHSTAMRGLESGKNTSCVTQGGHP